MVEYTDRKYLHNALTVFGEFKEKSYFLLGKLICDWVGLYNGYPNATCQFTKTQMQVSVGNFTLVKYDFKHKRELVGRLQTIGIDGQAIETIDAVFQMLDSGIRSHS